jgi:hypothetical protein
MHLSIEKFFNQGRSKALKPPQDLGLVSIERTPMLGA